MYYNAAPGRQKIQTYIMKRKSTELITVFIKQCICISCKSIKPQWSNLSKFTVLQSLSVAFPLHSHFDTQSFTIVVLDRSYSADRNSLSGRRHAHDDVITVFQVKPSTMKYKPRMRPTEISDIKNFGELKCQEIVSLHYN